MGFIYFFKHKNFEGVKIGMTNKDDVKDRFNAFKTYAPNGAEVLGQIETSNANELEKQIHKDYENCRMEGEFFKLSYSDVQDIIENYQILNIIYLLGITVLLGKFKIKIFSFEQYGLYSAIREYYTITTLNIKFLKTIESSFDAVENLVLETNKYKNKIKCNYKGCIWFEMKTNR